MFFFLFGDWGQVFKQNEAKTLGQAGDFRNGWIWQILHTFVPWANTWGCLFSFLGIGDEFLGKTRLRLVDVLFSNYTIGTSNHLKVTEVEPSAVRTFDSFRNSVA